VNKVVISKEIIERIKKYAAIKPEEQHEYIPVAFREIEEESLKPVFTIKPVSGENLLRMSDAMSGEVVFTGGVGNVKVKRGSFVVDVVKKGLVGWRNFYDLSGNVIVFKSDAPSFEFMQRKLFEELANAILSLSSLTEDEVLGLK